MSFTSKFFALTFVTVLFSSQLQAFNAYYLYNKNGTDIWAIECADGTLHSYAGSAGGLSTVGPALCEGHGGVMNPNNDTIRPTLKCKTIKQGGPRPRPVRPLPQG